MIYSFYMANSLLESKKTKVSIIGAGRVGITAAFTMYLKNTAQEIMLFGRDKDKLIGEQSDFMDSLSFLGTTHVTVGDEMSDLAGSDVIVFTAGAAQEPGETRLDLVKKNTDILASMIPEIVKYAPETIIVIVTNPVDVLPIKLPRWHSSQGGECLAVGQHLILLVFDFNCQSI